MSSTKGVPVSVAHVRGHENQPLDLPLLLTPAAEAFFEQATGIKDPIELKTHLEEVQAFGYNDVHPYPCIRSFSFAILKVASHPVYQQVLARGKSEELPFFLDMGCCFGTDVRKAVLDGYQSESVIGTDLQQGFIDLGYRLFRDKDSPSVPPFVVGDVFDTSFFNPAAPLSAEPLNLRATTSLTPLKGKLRAIHAGSFFHLFDEETQEKLAHLVASLVVHKSGTTIFGSHVGQEETGLRPSAPGEAPKPNAMFCHNPASWKALWETILGDKVVVTAVLEDRSKSPMRPPVVGGDLDQDSINNYKASILVWSVAFV